MNLFRRFHHTAHFAAIVGIPVYIGLRLERPFGDGLNDLLIGMGIGACVAFVLAFTRLGDERPAP